MMSLSHFDEKSGIVPCITPWGQWWQTVSEVFIDVNVPKGTRGKDCKVVFKPNHIECIVKNEVIFQGDLFESIVVADCTWTLEEQSKISILLEKSKKFTTNNLWESLLSDNYAPDALLREQMLKKLDLEKMQAENDEGGSPMQREEDAESIASASDEEAEGSNQQVAEAGSDLSAPASPAGSVASDRSEEEVHISEGEGSNAGSDMEQADNDSGSEAEGSDNEADDAKAGDSDHEVPEINIQSEDEDNADEDKASSDDERKADSDDEENAVKAGSEDEGHVEKAGSDDEGPMEKADSDDEDNAQKADSDDEENALKVDSDEEANHSDVEKNENEGRTSPAPGEDSEMAVDKTANSDDEDEEKASPKKDTEKETEHDGSDGEGKEYGSLVANIFGDSDDEEGSPIKEGKVQKRTKKVMKKRKVISDSEDEGEKSDAEEVRDDAPEEEEKKEEHGSDAEGDKEDGDKMDLHPNKGEEISAAKSSHQVSDDDSDEGIDDKPSRSDFISDFDLMMQKKKESAKKRKRKDVDIINDSDDLIADIISQMRLAAEDDRLLNKGKKTATKKLKILPMVMSQLKKQDLKMAFLDQGILNVMADWLAPLPDRSLPNLQIREGMIRRLGEFPCFDQSLLKSSGVGRALMYLYKHPKETKENKEKAGKLITEWARPIFNVTTDYHALTKEEREQRDFDHIPKKKRSREDGSDPEDSPEKKDIDKALREGDKKIRPGEKGWIGRARVPLPSTRDYVVRPKWNVEMEFGRSSNKKALNRFEKHIKTVQEKKRNNKALQAVTISIEGRKMAI